MDAHLHEAALAARRFSDIALAHLDGAVPQQLGDSLKALREALEAVDLKR